MMQLWAPGSASRLVGEVALTSVRILRVLGQVGIAASVDAHPTAVRRIQGRDLAGRTGDRISRCRGSRERQDPKGSNSGSSDFPHGNDTRPNRPGFPVGWVGGLLDVTLKC